MESFRAPVWGECVVEGEDNSLHWSFSPEFHYPKLVLYMAWLESSRNLRLIHMA